MHVLITGGLGFIGSHAAIILLDAGYKVTILDNLSNSNIETLSRIIKIAHIKPDFVKGDIRDYDLLQSTFAKYEISAVLHFAGLKSVKESFLNPMDYYDNNFNGTVCLCKAMNSAGIFNLVFSSSATVYGDQDSMPINESSLTMLPTNPYGRSKYMVEAFLKDLCSSNKDWAIGLLRYFNPIGAHKSGKIGEVISTTPDNLLPSINNVALGRARFLQIYGNDYDTSDGTGVRDYVHVVDLVEGHLAALEYLTNNKGINCWNLGTGIGYSVLEIVKSYEEVSGKQIKFKLLPRRKGDVSISFADNTKAIKELIWKPKRDLNEMMLDNWRWVTSSNSQKV